MRAYIGLGSNMGDRDGSLKEALRLLGEAVTIRVVAVSSFIETEPVGPPGQGKYINAVAEVETTLSPDELLAVCQGVENKLGRVRTAKWGPRTIDLDILLFGDVAQSTGRLIIPHPLMHERRFVLEPLAEIAPDAVHPVLKKTVKELLDALCR